MAYSRDDKKLPHSQYELSKGEKNPTFGRQNDIRRDDDKHIDLKIGLYDLDYCIKYYFENTIKPKVDDFGKELNVPVVYGSPERWKTMQQDGYIRDVGGQILKPVIAYRRSNIVKNRNLGNKVDANFPAVYKTQEIKYNKQNRYDQFSVLTNLQPSRNFINTIIPEYVDVTYEIVIWTDFVEHMNSIVESVIYSEGTYWGDMERFKFRTKIDDFQNTTDLLADGDRTIRTNMTLTMYGHIIPDALVKHLSKHISNKTYSVQQMNTQFNTDPDPSVFQDEQSVGAGAAPQFQDEPTIDSAPNPIIGSLDETTIIYLNSNHQLLATSIAVPDTATFPAGFLTAPASLPATDKGDFQFYINGQYVEPAAVISFTDNGNNTSTVVFDTGELGFTLNASLDEIVAIGKFDV